jgi:ElaB/YqjD/DUF883 family membrane-anchored ribosome-binding protein
MQRHVNDWVGTLKDAIPFLQILQCSANRVHGMDGQKSKHLAEVLSEARDIVKAAEDARALMGVNVPTFESELKSLINRYSKENGSNTPDFILAAYLVNTLNIFDIAIQDRAKWHGEVLPRAANEANKPITETLESQFNRRRKEATRQIMEDIERKTVETLHGYKKEFAYVPTKLLEEFNRVNTELAELWQEGRVSCQEYKDLKKRANKLAETMNKEKEAIEKEAGDKMARMVADAMKVTDSFVKAAKAIQVFNKEAKEAEATRKKFEHMEPKTGNGDKKPITDEKGFLFIAGNGEILWAFHDGQKYCFCNWEGSAWIGWRVSEADVIEAGHTQLPLFLDHFVRSICPTN